MLLGSKPAHQCVHQESKKVELDQQAYQAEKR